MRRLSPEPLIHDGAEIRSSTLGAYCEIQTGTRLLNVRFGDYSYTDRFADIANAEIGKFANIAAFVRINGGNHPTWRVSQHHFQYRASMYWDDAEDEAEFFEWRASTPVVTGHDIWLGNGALVMAGCRIGDGVVLGAGSVLTKDVPPYEIWAGNPARKIRDRHPPALAARLQAVAWWDWSHEALRKALPDFRALSVEGFLEKYEL
ncbi:MAG: chloramphenicol acetyltransferase [Pseudomonadota bacterium]